MGLPLTQPAFRDYNSFTQAIGGNMSVKLVPLLQICQHWVMQKFPSLLAGTELEVYVFGICGHVILSDMYHNGLYTIFLHAYDLNDIEPDYVLMGNQSTYSFINTLLLHQVPTLPPV